MDPDEKQAGKPYILFTFNSAESSIFDFQSNGTNVFQHLVAAEYLRVLAEQALLNILRRPGQPLGEKVLIGRGKIPRA